MENSFCKKSHSRLYLAYSISADPITDCFSSNYEAGNFASDTRPMINLLS